jgi:hypothetical protein
MKAGLLVATLSRKSMEGTGMGAESARCQPHRNLLGVGVILAVLGWLTGNGTEADETPADASPGSPEVIVVDVPLSQFVQRRRLSADRVGVLKSTPAEGDRVEAGAIVARLRDDVPQAMLAAAEARAASTVDIEASEKYAESEKFEYQVMVEANATRPAKPPYPNSDVQRARLRSESATLQGAVKRHEQQVNGLLRDQAQAELRTFEIVSPISGVVSRVFRHEGEGVQQSEAILEVVNTDRIRVEGRLPAKLASRVRVGAPVRVKFDSGESPGQGDAADGEITGVLGFVDVSAEGVGPERRVRVWADLDNPGGRLRDGLPAKLTIVLQPRGVPSTAEAPSPDVK